MQTRKHTPEFHWTLTGGLVTTFNGMDILWTGNGSTTIYLAPVRGSLVRIEPDKYQHDGSKEGAKRAMAAFIADGS